MTNLTLSERIESYVNAGFVRSIFLADDGRILGTWFMGHNYTVSSGLYGGYPHGYMKRIRAMFPDKHNVLHLFSGEVDLSIIPGKTVDLNPDRNPDYVDNAQTLTLVPVEEFDLIMADPPYSIEDCEHYGTTMVKRNRVMDVLGRRMKPGAYVIWLDQVQPMYRKSDFEIVAAIGMVKSTNHRFRIITIFRKK